MAYVPRYFRPDEFRCNCGKCGLGVESMDEDFLRALDCLRHAAGIPLVLTSAIRCAEHNDAVGGVQNSAHVRGHAADIHVPDNAVRYKVLRAAIVAGFSRIGMGRTFIHVDNDRDKARDRAWLY